MSTGADDEDPGWRLTPSMFLFLLPGFLALQARKASHTDGLQLVRQLWLAFAMSVALYGVVLLFVAEPSGESVAPWVVALAIAHLVSGTVLGRVLARPLPCEAAALAGAYRSRFFLGIAVAEAPALLAFVGTFLTGRAWLYWLFLPLVLGGLLRAAPTPTRIRADQGQLHASGCSLSLVGALRGTRPTDR